MKKSNFFMAFMMIAISSICVFVTSSCSKDEDKTCTCTVSDLYSGYSDSQQLDPASFGATNCSDLAVKLRMANDDEDLEYNCH